jgi:cupin 2 domain-containing protein
MDPLLVSYPVVTCNPGTSNPMNPDNIFASIPSDLEDEVFERLAGTAQVSIERIISHGHTSPASGWYDQDTREWVIVLRGEARLSFEDRTSVHLRAGDYIDLPAHRKHRVDWTTPERATVWLAVHYRE